MNAVFSYTVRYQVEATCKTPLRTGGAQGGVEEVLRDHTGCPFVQASSVSGAMRDWLEAHGGAKVAETLFGQPSRSGRLILSDARFDSGVQICTRPRLHIDNKTGTAQAGQKYDMVHIPTGSKCRFSVDWLGDQEHLDELKQVERMFAAMNAGEIRLGGQKTAGFGRVALTVAKAEADLTDTAQRNAWINDRLTFKTCGLPPLRGSDTVTFRVRGTLDTVLVKSASREQDGDKNIAVNMTESGRAIIPGSSVKGAVKNRAIAVAEYLGIDPEAVNQVFGRMAAEDHSDNGVAGTVFFEDVVLENKTAEVTRIRVDRFTGGVVNGGLFTERVHSSQLEMTVRTSASSPLACGLLTYSLRDLIIGMYNLGSGGAVGRGYFEEAELTVCAPDGTTAVLSAGKNGECTAKDPKDLFKPWLKAVSAAAERGDDHE